MDAERVREKVESLAQRLRMSTEPGSDFGDILALLAPREWAPGDVVREWAFEGDDYRLLYRHNGRIGVDFKAPDESSWLAASGADWPDHVAKALGLPLQLPAPVKPTWDELLSEEEFDLIQPEMRFLFGDDPVTALTEPIVWVGETFASFHSGEKDTPINIFRSTRYLRPADRECAVLLGREPGQGGAE